MNIARGKLVRLTLRETGTGKEVSGGKVLPIRTIWALYTVEIPETGLWEDRGELLSEYVGEHGRSYQYLVEQIAPEVVNRLSRKIRPDYTFSMNPRPTCVPGDIRYRVSAEEKVWLVNVIHRACELSFELGFQYSKRKGQTPEETEEKKEKLIEKIVEQLWEEVKG